MGTVSNQFLSCCRPRRVNYPTHSHQSVDSRTTDIPCKIEQLIIRCIIGPNIEHNIFSFLAIIIRICLLLVVCVNQFVNEVSKFVRKRHRYLCVTQNWCIVFATLNLFIEDVFPRAARTRPGSSRAVTLLLNLYQKMTIYCRCVHRPHSIFLLSGRWYITGRHSEIQLFF